MVPVHASEYPDRYHDPYSIDSDSEIYGPAYEAIVEELDTLAQTHPRWAERIVYGLSIQGRPLNLIRIRAPGRAPLADGRAVFIGGAIHGDEYLNIEDRLPRWILESAIGHETGVDRFFAQGGVLYIAPILNPDGYAARERWNAKGEDLNRDFTVERKHHQGFDQPETRALSEYLDRDLRTHHLTLALSLDYHCCQGSLLYPWSFRAEDVPPAILSQFQLGGRIMHQSVNPKYKVGRTPDVLGYEAIGASKDYYFEHFGAVSYTFEGVRRLEQGNFEKHTRMWSRFFEELVVGAP